MSIEEAIEKTKEFIAGITGPEEMSIAQYREFLENLGAEIDTLADAADFDLSTEDED